MQLELRSSGLRQRLCKETPGTGHSRQCIWGGQPSGLGHEVEGEGEDFSLNTHNTFCSMCPWYLFKEQI